MDDRINNLSQENNDEGVEIPVNVRDVIRQSMQQSPPEDDIVDEYEARYGIPDPTQDEMQQNWRNKFNVPPAQRNLQRANPTPNSKEEQTWAAIAHGSALLTIAVGMATASFGSLLTLFIPLAIYFVYREKSEFVARHALQAFAAQVVGVIGFVVLLLSVVAVWVPLLILSALLIILLVGIILFPLVLLAGLLAIGLSFLLPFGLLVYSAIAAVEAWNGHNYNYPWLGDWVDDQLYD